MFKHILVPLDGSKMAEAALPVAVHLAWTLGSLVTLVHILEIKVPDELHGQRHLVPHYAMSGGTLIALSADEIVMDPNAVLGPVDPQIGDLPAASIIRTVELKTPQGVNDQTMILADISSKAINQILFFVTELLGTRMPKDQAERIAALLATGQFTHDFPITVERASSIGLPISKGMPDSIYRLMDLYPQSGVGRPSVTYVPMR